MRFYCNSCDAIHPEHALALLPGPVDTTATLTLPAPVDACPECYGPVRAIEERELVFRGEHACRAIHGDAS
jgi:hypothetical protein